MKPTIMSEFHVRPGVNDNWVVISQTGVLINDFRRRRVAEAYGKALAHRARVPLAVHGRDDGVTRFSGRELTYAICL